VNRIARRTVMCMLLIVVVVAMWNLFGSLK
jgi:hypothetical protein